MGRLKDIRENAPQWMKMSLVDLAELMDPTLQNKYTQMIVNLLNTKMTESKERMLNEYEGIEPFINEVQHRLPHYSAEFFKSLSQDTLIMQTRLMDVSPFNYNDYRDISDFISRHMNNKFFGVDVNQVKTMSEIQKHNSIASIKEIEKEMENQVVVVLNSENWLAVRPITYQSSLKYGATTKWCTASRDNHYHFFKYTENGKLVYLINKKTGEKTAMFEGYPQQSSTYEISFWNQIDERIDSLMANLDNEIMDVLKNIIKDDTGSNKSLNSEMWLESRKMENENDGMLKKVSLRESFDAIPLSPTEESVPSMEEQLMEQLMGGIMESEDWDTEACVSESELPTASNPYAEVSIRYVDHMDNRGMRG